MSRLVVVWDIDGTLADNSHRASLLEKQCRICLHKPLSVAHGSVCSSCGSIDALFTSESWEAFLDPFLMMKDTPISTAMSILEQFRKSGASNHFITARSYDAHGLTTAEWLSTKVGRLPDEQLFMRTPEDEGIPASVYKERALKRLKDEIGDEGTFIFFEDHPHVCKMYSNHGLVIKCPEGLQYLNPSSPTFDEVIHHV